MKLHEEGIVPDLIVMLERPDELVKEFSMGRCTDSTTGVIYHPKVSFFSQRLSSETAKTVIRGCVIAEIRGAPCEKVHPLTRRYRQYHVNELRSR